MRVCYTFRAKSSGNIKRVQVLLWHKQSVDLTLLIVFTDELFHKSGNVSVGTRPHGALCMDVVADIMVVQGVTGKLQALQRHIQAAGDYNTIP